jgi:Family of unknown function (DUF6132)
MLKIVLGIIVGAGLGFAIHRMVGCSTGACPIWNSPVYAVLYGAGLGGLLTSNF